MAIPEAAEGLYSVPPARFVAERNALARALAERGDRDAAAVRRLRRPVGLAWVMNHLAREQPERVKALLAAGDRLGRAQRRALAGEGGADLREAERDLREGARSLREAASSVLDADGRPGKAGALARLELLLRVAATGPPDVRDALRGSVLEREPDVATPDLSGLAVFAGGAAAKGPRRDRGSAPQEGAAARGAPAGSGREAPPPAAARRIERAERARESREGRLRAREAAEARRDLSRARSRASRAERALAAAEARLRRARETAEAAQRAADEARREVDAARREVDRRRSAVPGPEGGR